MFSWLEISKKNILHNLRELRKLSKGAEIIPVVKSNAYGHGLLEVARILACDKAVKRLAVFAPEEAAALRRAGIHKKVLILGPLGNENFLRELNNVEMAVVSPEDFQRLDIISRRLKKVFFLHLKIETGMNRLGLSVRDVKIILARAGKNPYLKITGLFSHFADVSGKGGIAFSLLQIKRFGKAEEAMRAGGMRNFLRHIAASPGILGGAGINFDAVRPGIALYGLWPDKQSRFKNKIHLKPVLSWKTKVAQVKEVKASEAIGYGRAERVKKKTKIAVLPVGYWDGYDRRLSHIGEVLIGGKRRKILGRVCMNLTMVDVGGAKNVKTGDEVALIGKQGKEEITADELAQKIGTINYEVTTRINPLIERRVK